MPSRVAAYADATPSNDTSHDNGSALTRTYASQPAGTGEGAVARPLTIETFHTHGTPPVRGPTARVACEG